MSNHLCKPLFFNAEGNERHCACNPKLDANGPRVAPMLPSSSTKSPLLQGIGLALGKTAAWRRRYGETSVQFGLHSLRCCVDRLWKGIRPACCRPPCAKTNGAELGAAPLTWADLRKMRESIMRHPRCGIPSNDTNAAARISTLHGDASANHCP